MQQVFIGEITHILEEKENDGFKSKAIILKLSNSNNHLKIEFVQDNISLLSKLSTRQMAKIACSLVGKVYTKEDGKEDCFNSLRGYKIQTFK